MYTKLASYAKCKDYYILPIWHNTQKFGTANVHGWLAQTDYNCPVASILDYTREQRQCYVIFLLKEMKISNKALYS